MVRELFNARPTRHAAAAELATEYAPMAAAYPTCRYHGQIRDKNHIEGWRQTRCVCNTLRALIRV